jgi:hypothetical protein
MSPDAPSARTGKQAGDERRNKTTMKTRFTSTALLAAVASLGLSIAPAFADGGQGTVPNTYFTELPGVVAKPATGGAATVQQQAGPSIGTYATNHSTGTWLFPPNPNQGGNS